MELKYIVSLFVFGFIVAFIGALTTPETIIDMTRDDPRPFVLYVLGLVMMGIGIGASVEHKEVN